MKNLPDFQEFLNQIDSFKTSEAVEQKINMLKDNPPESTANLIMELSTIMTVETLQRYHQWLQSLDND